MNWQCEEGHHFFFKNISQRKVAVFFFGIEQNHRKGQILLCVTDVQQICSVRCDSAVPQQLYLRPRGLSVAVQTPAVTLALSTRPGCQMVPDDSSTFASLCRRLLWFRHLYCLCSPLDKCHFCKHRCWWLRMSPNSANFRNLFLSLFIAFVRLSFPLSSRSLSVMLTLGLFVGISEFSHPVEYLSFEMSYDRGLVEEKLKPNLIFCVYCGNFNASVWFLILLVNLSVGNIHRKTGFFLVTRIYLEPFGRCPGTRNHASCVFIDLFK